jgi:hypothetical protein
MNHEWTRTHTNRDLNKGFNHGWTQSSEAATKEDDLI